MERQGRLSSIGASEDIERSMADSIFLQTMMNVTHHLVALVDASERLGIVQVQVEQHQHCIREVHFEHRAFSWGRSLLMAHNHRIEYKMIQDD